MDASLQECSVKKHLKDDAATQDLGASVAKHSSAPLVIHLRGDLGSGKTTFARGYIHALGKMQNVEVGNVKSPTFSLVETYNFAQFNVYHLDLYRLQVPEELEYIGIRDLVEDELAICLIEWPGRGGEQVPEPDIDISLTHDGEGRKVEIWHKSDLGLRIIGRL